MTEIKKKSKQATFTKWFGPLLDALRELGGSARPKEVVEEIAKKEKVSDSIREEIMKSGILRFDNQVAWARQYLVWEGLLDNSKKGVWTLTSKGQITSLTLDDSRKLFLKWVEIHQKAKKEKSSPTKIVNIQEEEEPEELEHEITPSLLEVLQSVTPTGFEHICKRLLREHGFENVCVTQASHDGGIDGYGTLELNPFVSMKVLFQCKRYKGTVSRAQIGDFRNAMIGRADKGIILTTGTFSEEAKREASRDGAPPIELIDGKKLVELFEKVELGLKPKIIYEVDYNFFEIYMKK
ncbi:restriction endonuclease [Chryseobacterium sp. Leaf404]|uniref:restriction endonuclease n=1 Tax=unclassified Chryseobacterium TaxID=2593645 RepID=UPI0006FF479F|nr:MULTISPECIES: restriction endonuclease [unclassified Chryseobacterium]KQT21445.1 restriction endonuclease [Chryseobacterium sp. Leaf404]